MSVNLGNIIALVKSETQPLESDGVTVKTYVLWAKILNPSFPNIVDIKVYDNSSSSWVNLFNGGAKFLQASVINRVDAPPSNPNNGDLYVVGTGTGAFNTRNNQIAKWVSSSSSWEFESPITRGLIFNVASEGFEYWNGTQWVSISSGSGGNTNLSVSRTATQVEIESDTGSNATIPEADGSNAGIISSSDKTKLDGIETGATADQTGSEIKSAYEAEANTNAFTDSEKAKLASIDATHYLDPVQSTTELSALNESSITDKARVYVEDETSDYFYDTQATSGDIAPDDQIGGTGWWKKVAVDGETATSIKTKYESNADTNVFNDAAQTKLSGIESNAKDDQNANEVPFTPQGGVAATDVQSAIEELDTEKLDKTLSEDHIFTGNSSNEAQEEPLTQILSGTSILVAGTVTISDTNIGASSQLRLTQRNDGGTLSGDLVGIPSSGQMLIESRDASGTLINTDDAAFYYEIIV